MNQKELAMKRGLTPIQVRGLIHSLRNKKVPVISRQGMAVCFDKDIVRKEALTLLNHARSEIEAATGLMMWIVDGESDEALTLEEELLLKELPVIPAPEEEVWDSSEEFPFIDIDSLA